MRLAGKIWSFFKKRKKIFTGAGAVFIFALLALAIFGVLYGASKSAKDGVQPSEEGLTNSSFTDLFSGVGWLDESLTDLYRDDVTTAFTFRPVFEWKKTEPANPPAVKYTERGADGSLRLCIFNRCLTQKNLNLYFGRNGADSPVSLPVELRSGNLINLSIGRLESLWVVGGVVKNASYSG